MGGVRRVGSEGATRRHDVDGRLAVLHHPDLHRRGVRAQHDLLGLAEVDEDGVEAAPGGMPVGDVERLEVVPGALDLGSFGHRVSHADEHVLEPVPGLGDWMEVPSAQRHLLGQALGEVETLGLVALGPVDGRQPLPSCGHGGFDPAPGLVELAAGCGPLARFEFGQPALGLGEPRAASQQLPLDAGHRVNVGGFSKTLLGVSSRLGEVPKHPCKARAHRSDAGDIQGARSASADWRASCCGLGADPSSSLVLT